MSRAVYLICALPEVSLEALVEQVRERWLRNSQRVAVLRPFQEDGDPVSGELCAGVSLAEALSDRVGCQSRLLSCYSEVAASHDAVIVLGSRMSGPCAPFEFDLNADLAATLGVPVLLVAPDEVAEAAVAAAEARHATVLGVLRQDLWTSSSPVVSSGDVDELLAHLRPGCVAVMDAGRPDLLLALAVAGLAGRVSPATIVCCGGLGQEWRGLLAAAFPEVPIEEVDQARASVATALRAACTTTALDPSLVLDGNRPLAMTPLRFEHGLLERARAAGQHIVLPEGDEPRVLAAAGRLLAGGVCELTLLGDPGVVAAKAAEVGVDISKAKVIDPASSELLEGFAQRYAELRAKKGVTIEQARQRVADVSYFGTMMVLEGLVGGMVSGAVHTTAHTIRPALEVIKTAPGVSVVSSAFLMCLADRVWVFGDCAVNPNPTAEQLADIALSSAQTAQAFGVEPRVAMLSYSTGESGSGPDVDLVAEATRIAAQRAPELALDGPLQFDAAVDPGVGQLKRPGSAVAGQATVFIFPDLSAGNIGYKAVQRTAGAVAIGPVLQGLNKPVNDLSRGATVDDIVNTIAITAIQAAL
ncbi:MAG: phosphate acetyltransferase [Propionibacteriaceae bacterium]|nr:phosphate acetyltransferase [Propionibacteriaceae bacterium]